MVDKIAKYVEETVEKISKEYGYDGKITMNSNLLCIGIDSLDVMEIVMSVENKYHIKVDDKRICKIETLNDLVQLVTTV